MTGIDTTAQYVLKTSLLGSSHALALISMNDNLLVEPSPSDDAQSRYFIQNDGQVYNRLHIQQNSDLSALYELNYNKEISIDPHFHAVQDNAGQLSRLTEYGDGSVKIN